MKIPDKINLFIVPAPSAIELTDDLLKTLDSELIPIQETSGTNSPEVVLLSKALVTVANQAWRIATAITDPETKETKNELSPQEIKKVGNALESMKETMGGLGIKIIDRLGQAFNAGLPEQVVTEETREGISKEQIVRTIRPTIMWHQTMVQRGEIDIAVPATKK
jgi:hypothetical protein